MTTPAGAQSGATGDGQSAGTGTQETATAADAGGQSAATGTPGTTPTATEQSVVSRAEYEQLRAQLAAADRKRVEAEQAHAQLRDKDMPQMVKLERDLAEAVKAQEAMTAANSALRVENAFLTANEHEWHNPSAALQLLDRSKITVDNEGNVQGMKDALKALATAHPYLLKPAPAGDGEGTGAPAGNAPPGTVPANGGIGQQQGTTPNKSEMAKRFPAMKQKLS